MNVPKLRFKEFSDEWAFTSFSEIFSILNGYAFSSKDFASQGIILTKIANVDFNYMNKTNLSFLPEEYLNKYSKFVLNKNDIVIALTRPILNNKLKIAIVDDFFDKSLLNQRVGKIISKHNNLFVYYMLQTKKCINFINVGIAGTDPPNLSPEKITYIKKYLPQSKEQNKIANFLSTVDKKISNLENIITNLENQKKGLLQQIFSQKLRFKDENGNNYPDWEKKNLDEISLITMGQSPDSKFINNEKIGIPFLQGNAEFTNKYPIEKYWCTKPQKIANPTDILLSVRAPVGAINTANKKFCIGRGLSAISFNCNKLFGKYSLEYNLFQLIKKSQGSTFTSVNKKDISEILLFVPCLEEQTKIADFLSAFDRKIDNQKAQLEHWKQIKKGLLQQMFV